jgi:3-hydroxybutyryl-CoA dehydrogenase
MKLLVLSDDDHKNELLACTPDTNVQLQWIDQPGSADRYTDIDACIDLLFENTEEKIQWLKELPAKLIIINSVVTPLKELPANFIRINGWRTFLRRNIMEAACNNEEVKKKAEELFSLLGRKTEWVPDQAGFIAPRVIASVINEAFITLEEEVSTENEIDTAMKMGTNYPFGPFEWGEKIGLSKVYSLLEALNQEQTRYKPSVLLRQKILV